MSKYTKCRDAYIGKKCVVEFEGKERAGKITDLVRSLQNTQHVILFCIRLDNGTRIGCDPEKRNIDIK